MSAWFGVTGDCWWAYGRGTYSEADWARNIQHLRDCRKATELKATFVTVGYQTSAPTVAQRKMVADFFSECDQRTLANIRGHAVVTDSVIVRGALTAINWVCRKKHPDAVFGSPQEALHWLAELSPETKPDEVLRAMRQAVPTDQWWGT